MKKNIKKITLLTIISISLLFAISMKVYAEEKDAIKKDEELRQNENILLLGDSLINLYKTNLIYEDLPIINSGIAGHSTEDVLKDMEARVYKYNPTKVFILIGTNDIYYKRDFPEKERINQTYNNINLIVDKIRKNRPKSDIYVISLLPINDNYEGIYGRHKEDIGKINTKLKKHYAKKEKVTYIDINKKFQNDEGLLKDEYTIDGLHINNLGYAKLTEILMKYFY